jgi:hypothetical protein
MGLIIVSLILFLALVVAWVVLPGSAMIVPAQESAEPLPMTSGQTA